MVYTSHSVRPAVSFFRSFRLDTPAADILNPHFCKIRVPRSAYPDANTHVGARHRPSTRFIRGSLHLHCKRIHL
ncbi:hypothetical protein HETIRDRAFT_418341 [Heterobasidion irregulare TC 32-1]|uniref:Uncharacterized protein n=1 Tax=Heterobasidion irregulare (strain TC 32-1) TaxID=747525 RepID=W4K3L2_HETIT|nr:uncharacterized protein HETIRDRAFT_418341 [Heterobasidion irregulare TC 32-1]ETW80314.1 hypothetical protein HETIRDRAFT_418341 [Heterobasidion irregulare TC 32-1]